MIEQIKSLLPILVFVSHFVLALAVLSYVFRNSFGREIVGFIRRHSITLSFLVLLVAVSGSLFYSNVVGYTPCVLCWWQRIFMYPQLVIFAIALRKKRLSAFLYSLPLSIMGGVIALYHSLSNHFGGSILPCTAAGGECSRVYVNAFDYVTIPVMALTVFLYLIIFALISRTHE